MPPVTGRNFQGEAKKASQNAIVYQHRERFTIAQINAGTITLLPAVPNYRYRMSRMAMISIGGTAGGATDVRIQGTQAATLVALMTAAVAALVQSLRLEAAAVATILASGLSFVENDVNTAIQIIKTGGALTTATHVDVLVEYVLERVN